MKFYALSFGRHVADKGEKFCVALLKFFDVPEGDQTIRLITGIKVVNCYSGDLDEPNLVKLRNGGLVLG